MGRPISNTEAAGTSSVRSRRSALLTTIVASAFWITSSSSLFVASALSNLHLPPNSSASRLFRRKWRSIGIENDLRAGCAASYQIDYGSRNVQPVKERKVNVRCNFENSCLKRGDRREINTFHAHFFERRRVVVESLEIRGYEGYSLVESLQNPKKVEGYFRSAISVGLGNRGVHHENVST